MAGETATIHPSMPLGKLGGPWVYRKLRNGDINPDLPEDNIKAHDPTCPYTLPRQKGFRFNTRISCGFCLDDTGIYSQALVAEGSYAAGAQRREGSLRLPLALQLWFFMTPRNIFTQIGRWFTQTVIAETQASKSMTSNPGRH
jgi:hypothetical protein